MRSAARYTVLALAAVAVLWAATRRGGDTEASEARRLVADGARLVDVRTTAEFTSGHLPGAVNIPVHQLAARLDEVGPKERGVVVYCTSGVRSAHAARLLREAGYARVLDLGGMSQW